MESKIFSFITKSDDNGLLHIFFIFPDLYLCANVFSLYLYLLCVINSICLITFLSQ
jgi:hypothetical protein